MPNALLTYFSWSGNTETIARRISENLRDYCIRVQKIRPVNQWNYHTWLTLSLVPSLRVPIRPLLINAEDYDLLLLGCPKWSLGCPPFSEFIHRLENSSGKKAAFFMTWGGFDGKRYANETIRSLENKGLNVLGCLMIRRRQIQTGEYVQLTDTYCRRLVALG
jgi:flavodoxin